MERIIKIVDICYDLICQIGSFEHKLSFKPSAGSYGNISETTATEGEKTNQELSQQQYKIVDESYESGISKKRASIRRTLEIVRNVLAITSLALTLTATIKDSKKSDERKKEMSYERHNGYYKR